MKLPNPFHGTLTFMENMMVVKNHEIDLHLLFGLTNFFWPRLLDLGKMKANRNPLFIRTRQQEVKIEIVKEKKTSEL